MYKTERKATSANAYLGRQRVTFSGRVCPKAMSCWNIWEGLEMKAKMRFQYLRNGELADFFFNIKTSFSTPMMLWDKITITWSSCGVRWPLEYVRYTYLHPLDWSVKVDGSERSRLLTKNSCSRMSPMFKCIPSTAHTLCFSWHCSSASAFSITAHSCNWNSEWLDILC